MTIRTTYPRLDLMLQASSEPSGASADGDEESRPDHEEPERHAEATVSIKRLSRVLAAVGTLPRSSPRAASARPDPPHASSRSATHPRPRAPLSRQYRETARSNRGCSVWSRARSCCSSSSCRTCSTRRSCCSTCPSCYEPRSDAHGFAWYGVYTQLPVHIARTLRRRSSLAKALLVPPT